MKYKDENIEYDDGNPNTSDIIELGGKLAEERDDKHKEFCKRVAIQRFTSDELFIIAKEKKEPEEKNQVHTLFRDEGYNE